MTKENFLLSFEICTHHFQTSLRHLKMSLYVFDSFYEKCFCNTHTHTHTQPEVENNWLLLLWFSIAIHTFIRVGEERDFYEWMMQILNLIIMNSPWIVLLFTVACRVFKKLYFIAINFLLILSAFVCHFVHSFLSLR